MSHVALKNLITIDDQIYYQSFGFKELTISLPKKFDGYCIFFPSFPNLHFIVFFNVFYSKHSAIIWHLVGLNLEF